MRRVGCRVGLCLRRRIIARSRGERRVRRRAIGRLRDGLERPSGKNGIDSLCRRGIERTASVE